MPPAVLESPTAKPKRRAAKPRARAAKATPSAANAALASPPPVEFPAPSPYNSLRMPMTREDFESRDWNTAAGLTWKFEWNNGFAEAYEERMKSTEINFMSVLPRRFRKCKHAEEGTEMFYEVECWLEVLGVMRKPDFCVFTVEQMRAAAEGKHPVPAFVIEVLSPNDSRSHTNTKLREYFAAGVQSVWHVDPMMDTVAVYLSPTQCEVMYGDEICSAAPAYPAFSMMAKEVFAKV